MALTVRTRRHLIASRWFSLLCSGAVAAAVVVLIETPLKRLGAPFADTLGRLPPLVTLLVVGTLIASSCWAIARGRWKGFIGLPHLFSYPPLWIAELWGLLVWATGRAWIDGTSVLKVYVTNARWFAAEIPQLAWIAVGGIVLAVALLPMRGDIRPTTRRRLSSTIANETPSVSLLRDFGTLREWLANDEPVLSPAEDLFKHRVIADRISDRLLAPSESATMAVIGPLGSGKTTVRRLVECRLSTQRRICIASVSLWPFDSAEAAVRGILRTVLQALGRQVNVLPLVGLSDDYVTAIEKTTGTFGGIARLLRVANDPSAIVQRFSNIAQAAGIRIVLWVEDLERFSGGDQLEGIPRIEREVERLGSIRALLHLLDVAPCISVIVSDVSLRSRFDLGKIARFVEHIPAMDEEDAWRAVELLRTTCLQGYPIQIIDPASSKVREALQSDPTSRIAQSWFPALRLTNPTVPAAVVRVLTTPRSLKSALRVALETWEAMPGEIDLDWVLVVSVLRTARPEIFALVADHIDLFRQGREKEKPFAISGQIEELLAREDNRSLYAVNKIITYLFPKYLGTIDHTDFIYQPQSLSLNNATDYWRRYLTQARVPNTESDQIALQNIRAWRAGQPSDLIHRVVDASRSGQIESFIAQFKKSDLGRLLGEIADCLSTQSASTWMEQAFPTGIAVVRNMMLRRTPSDSEVFDATSDIIKRLGPTHLPLAHAIAYSFAMNGADAPRLMNNVQRAGVRRLLQNLLAESFTGPEAEASLKFALRDGTPWIVAWIAWGIDRIDDKKRTGLPFESWPSFATVLLNLAEQQPQVGVPQIIPFVTHGEMSLVQNAESEDNFQLTTKWTGEFNEESASRLFPIERLMRTIARYQIPIDLTGQKLDYFQAVTKAAHEWVSGG